MNRISGQRFQDNAGRAQSMYMPHIAPRTILTSTFPAGKNSSQGRIPWETTIWRGTIWKTIFLTRIYRIFDDSLGFALFCWVFFHAC